ncbi:MAG: crossover junction endodeoxyribonuclease RuvC [Parachlamydiaceae bacterium]|nr:MAG: crossover junction endodeoxyribonuclease RuvC [Parachlamydiaceae bacterium]
MEQHVIIIGLDPGTRITGFGIIKVSGNQYQALDYGCIRPPSKDLLTDRYLIIYNALEEIIEKYKPDALVIETQYVKENIQSAIKLGMVRGIAIIVAKSAGIPVFEYAPTKAKLAVVGRGHASKAQVQRMVQVLLRLSQLPEPEDAADALALAICHAHSAQHRELMAAQI